MSMKALTCEMCGSTNLIKKDGVFVCQSCGTKYSVEEAKKMMVEGTVSVEGTVKVDTSDELKNLYTLARRAKDMDNDENAAKYYGEILVKDPDSWEANFYLVYYKASGCKKGQIGNEAHNVSKCLKSTVELLVQSLGTGDETKKIIAGIQKDIIKITRPMINGLYDISNFSYMGSVFGMLESLGDSLSGYEELQQQAVDAWSASVQEYFKDACLSEPDDKNGKYMHFDLSSIVSKILKVDPSYDDPFGRARQLRGNSGKTEENTSKAGNKTSEVSHTKDKGNQEPNGTNKKIVYIVIGVLITIFLGAFLIKKCTETPIYNTPIEDNNASSNDTEIKETTLIPNNNYSTQSNQQISESEISESDSQREQAEKKHQYVDLGLSVKWATCNIGATTPEAYGGYYAWGETSTKSVYDWTTYRYCDGAGDKLTKYCTERSHGIVDDRTILELNDDAAHVNWGGSWRMPTKDEMQELLDHTDQANVEVNGIRGTKFTADNGNSIFLPAAGCCYDNSNFSQVGSCGFYWTSSLSGNYAFGIYFNSRRTYKGCDNYRTTGQSIRAVCPK